MVQGLEKSRVVLAAAGPDDRCPIIPYQVGGDSKIDGTDGNIQITC